MFVTHLSLTNFRNFSRLEVDFSDGPVLLVGTNAQGKTSLLEAIYFFSSASSPHTTSDRELINFLTLQEDRPFARMAAEIQRSGRRVEIEIRLILESTSNGADQRLRKEILVNGAKTRQSRLSSAFNAVLFLPQYMQILEGSPTERRRHLDALICQADPVYADTLGTYNRILSQRNALLKQLQERRGGEEQLQFWDERFVDAAARLVQRRSLTFRELEPSAGTVHTQLTRGAEVLQFLYQPRLERSSASQLDLPLNGAPDLNALPIEDIRQNLQKTLAANRREEIGRGMTITGPHRDDFSFLANQIDLRTYGSRGQNRTALLSLMLAEVDWLRQQTGEWPVLLLDEVLAELDPARRTDLLEHISDANQVMVTAADLEMFTEPFCKAAAVYEITSGKLAKLAADPS